MHAVLHPDYFKVTGRQHGAKTGELRSAAICVLVASDGDQRICGAAQVRIYDTPADPALVSRRRAHVEQIVVDRDLRLRGVGRRLMQAVERWAAERGATQVLLTVWQGNREAEAFYRALGYRTISRVLGRELGERGRCR